MSYKKLKNTFIKEENTHNKHGIELVNCGQYNNFYISSDNKFYCVCIRNGYILNTTELIGIFDKITGKYFAFIYHCSLAKGIHILMVSSEYDLINISDYTIDNISDPLDVIVEMEEIFIGIESRVPDDSSDSDDDSSDSNSSSDSDSSNDSD